MRLFVFAALVCSVTACGPNRPFRVTYPPGQPPVVAVPEQGERSLKGCGNNEEGTGKYQLAFIEFDDQGEMFNHQQLVNALRMIEDAKRATSEAAEAAGDKQRSLAVATFVHGWKNNASEGSNNVHSFRQMLACLDAQWSPGPVVGVYIGWRGDSLPIPVAEQFTYWGRRNKSATLPNAHMVEALKEIMLATEHDLPRVQLFSVMIGHSFGGGLLKSAMTQTLVNGILETPRGREISWPADLVVFVNEASPAVTSYQLIETMMRNIEPRPACGASAMPYGPALLSIASSGDTATRGFFPFAQSITRLFHRLRRYPGTNALGVDRQSRMYYTTAPFMAEFQSHEFDLENAPAVAAARASKCSAFIEEEKLSGSTYSFIQRPGARNATPYWVARMPKTIVADHGGIFTSEFRKLLIDILLVQRLGVTPYVRK